MPRKTASRVPGLGVAVPLGMAILLSGTFIALVLFQARKGRDDASAPASPEAPAFSRTAIPPREFPHGSPSEAHPFRWPDKEVRHAGKFPRWNLRSFPEGWNEELALEIHAFFEAMQTDGVSEDKLATIEATREQLREFLAGLGPDAVPTLAAILNVEGDFVDRRFLLYGLGGLGEKSEAATFALRDFFIARHEDPQNRSEMIHVVKAMELLKNDTSFDTLGGLIERPDLHSYRDRFIEALGEHPRREEAQDVFVEKMHRDQAIHVRNRAAQALGKMQSRETLEDLYSAIENESYWVVKQTMLGSIGKMQDPSSLPFLAHQARNARESGVRLSAAGAIRRVGTAAGQKILEDLARREEDEAVRKHIEAWAREGKK